MESDPPPGTPAAAYWDEVAEVWLREQPQRLWRLHSDAVNRAMLGRWLPARVERLLKTDLFDEAVGQGLYELLTSRAQSVWGVDIAAAVATAAGAKHAGLRTAQADVRALPFPDAEFDVVVSNSTLDHLHSVEEIGLALREFRRVLRPGGELVLTLDNPANPAIALRRMIPRRLFDRVWRLHAGLAARLLPAPIDATCGPRRARRLLAEAGFEVLDAGAVVHCPRALAVLVADVLDRRAGPRGERWFLGALMGFERLSRLPTRYVTGHFVAFHARAAR